VSTAGRRERLRRGTTPHRTPDGWEVVAELVASDGNNDAALRQITADHPEIRSLPEQDVRVDLLCGRSSSSVRGAPTHLIDDGRLTAAEDVDPDGGRLLGRPASW
jgi:hypothetical protein